MIEINPKVCFGKPVFTGTRIPVYMVLELLAAGKSKEEILQDYYPTLSEEAIYVAMQYAAKRLRNEEVILISKPKFPYAISL